MEHKSDPGHHIEQVIDRDYIGGRAGTLLVSTHFEKSELGAHDIKSLDTSAASGLKTTADGMTILIPQPTNDPEQALNWSWWRKHRVLFVLVYCTLMTDLSSAWEVPLVVPQAVYWNISITDAGRNLSGNVFMLAAGGLFAVPLARWVGRLPVMFWSMVLGFAMSIFCTLAPTWISFIVARCLQAFLITSPQVIGLIMIHDMFFFHERARKIGIWAATFIVSPFTGPFLSGIMVNYTSWRNSMWLCTGLIGIGIILVVFLGDETLYRPVEDAREPKTGYSHRVLLLTGVSGARSYSGGVQRIIRDMGIMITRPQFLGICVFYMLTFMWSIGLNATLVLFVSPPPPIGYGWSDLKVALLYISPMLAALLGEIFGHWMNDFIANRSIRRSGGRYEAEVRIMMIWISLPFLLGGLVFFGYSLKLKLSWIPLCFAWGFYQFGMVTSTVATTAYVLDIFPDYAVEASAITNMFRVLGGFIVNYFQVEWARSFGPENSFGVEAGIVGVGFIVAVVVQVFGGRWRAKFPMPNRE